MKSMKKQVLAFALVLLAAAVSLLAQPAAAQKAEDALALKGFDPVMLITGKEVKGDEKLSVSRGGFKYLFSSTESKATFEKEPKKYEIQLGGTCAVVPGADGDPELFVVYKERIYIFASPHCVEQFKAKPDDFVKN
jgi:YHS domain-containing protein